MSKYTGACEKCHEGYINAHTVLNLKGTMDISGRKLYAYEQFCVKAVKDCKQYELNVISG